MVFILIKKEPYQSMKGTTNNTIPPMEQAPKKRKSCAKRKKGANCRAVKAKANAAPTINENTPKKKYPKEEIPQIKPHKALFFIYP